MEGRIEVDIAPLARRWILGATSVSPETLKATAELQILRDPWVFCTSISPDTDAEAFELARRIDPDYDTATDILDSEAFATRLGIDFAIALDLPRHVESQSALDLVTLAQSRFQKIVHVRHGPVVYEDHSGVVRTEQDFRAFDHGHTAGFVKRCAFSHEQEYRFAVSTFAQKTKEIFCLPISGDLRELSKIRE